MNDNIYYWKNIDIEKDLRVERVENDQNNNVWIKYIKTNQKLRIILDPMFVKTVRLFPYGNWIGEKHENTIITNQNRRWMECSARKLEDASSVLTLEPILKTKDNQRKTNDEFNVDQTDKDRDQRNDAIECVQWIERLEIWFIEQCFEIENLWKKEKNKIKNQFKNGCNKTEVIQTMLQGMYKNVKKEDKNNDSQCTFGIVQPIFQRCYGDSLTIINDKNQGIKKNLSDK